jgi:hypothetical protein
MNTPNAVAVPQNIAAGLELLTKRLLPAKLRVEGAEGKKNGYVLNAWAIRENLKLVTMKPQEIADAFYRAVQQDCAQFPQSQLMWEIPPKALTREQSKAPSTRQDTRTAGDFEAKVRASEKIDEQRRAQAAARKRVTEIVDRFAPVNHRRGVMNYDLRDSKQKEWRKKIAEAKDFVALESAIRKESAEIYARLEKQAERV